MAKSAKKLTTKERRFVAEYAADPNATQAYFRAYGGVTSKGRPRSYNAAGEQARRLLGKPEIQAELRVANADYAARVRVSKLRTLRELAAVAFSDPADAFLRDPAGGPLLARPLHDIPAATRRAIQSVKVKRRRLAGGGNETYEVEEVEYKFAPKMAALDSLCKRLGLFREGDPAASDPAKAVPVELLTRILALAAAARGVEPGGPGGDPPGGAVGAEPGAAGAGVPV